MLWDLAPDIVGEPLYTLVLEPFGLVGAVRFAVTLSEGGRFESYSMNVVTVSGGRLQHNEYFEIEDVDAALARFAELRRRP